MESTQDVSDLDRELASAALERTGSATAQQLPAPSAEPGTLQVGHPLASTEWRPLKSCAERLWARCLSLQAYGRSAIRKSCT